MVPGTTTGQTRRVPGTSFVYAYPIYLPLYDPSMYAAPAPEVLPAQPAPSVVIYTSQPAPATPAETVHPSMQVYEPEAAPPQPAAAEAPSTDHYLFAFKDHSIYSAVAYWVDGDTLHYFTSGDTHKQAPLATLDRELTDRLNRELGFPLKLPPPAKQ